MSQQSRRPLLIFQACLLLSTLAFSALTGGGSCCSCSCDTGSDHKRTHSSQLDKSSGAVLMRWHDIELQGNPLTLTEKDLAYVRSRLPGNIIMGLQVPCAPGASQPGDLTPDGHNLTLNLSTQDSGTIRREIPLVSRDDLAPEIAAVFPPDPGTHWQALVPANDDYIGYVPTQTTTFTGGSGWLYYELDFHGDDLCNGCMVKMTVCGRGEIPLWARLAARALPGGLKFHSAGDLTCVDCVPSVIRLMDESRPPSSVTAWFSPWGGPVFNAVYGPTVEMEYALGHSSAQTKTFTLEPIQSEKGWAYEWRNLDDEPISQIAIGPEASVYSSWEENLKIVGTVPTCTLAVDTIHITATSAITPSLYAVGTSVVSVYPDPHTCPVADLAIAQVASSGVISAGQSVSFTLTITNYEQTATDAVVVSDLSSEAAIGDLILPPGCERDGAKITCQVPAVAPDGSVSLTIVVRVSRSFDGVLSSRARVDPADGTDVRLYDNLAGPTDVTVSRVNQAPNAVDDTASTDSGIAVTIDVLANDSDPDGDPLTITAIGTPDNGSATNNVTDVSYLPNADFWGTEVFTYTISDSSLTDTATVTVTVTQRRSMIYLPGILKS